MYGIGFNYILPLRAGGSEFTLTCLGMGGGGRSVCMETVDFILSAISFRALMGGAFAEGGFTGAPPLMGGAFAEGGFTGAPPLRGGAFAEGGFAGAPPLR